MMSANKNLPLILKEEKSVVSSTRQNKDLIPQNKKPVPQNKELSLTLDYNFYTRFVTYIMLITTCVVVFIKYSNRKNIGLFSSFSILATIVGVLAILGPAYIEGKEIDISVIKDIFLKIPTLISNPVAAFDFLENGSKSHNINNPKVDSWGNVLGQGKNSSMWSLFDSLIDNIVTNGGNNHRQTHLVLPQEDYNLYDTNSSYSTNQGNDHYNKEDIKDDKDDKVSDSKRDKLIKGGSQLTLNYQRRRLMLEQM